MVGHIGEVLITTALIMGFAASFALGMTAAEPITIPECQDVDYDYFKNLTIWLNDNANNRANDIKQNTYDWRSVCNPQITCPESKNTFNRVLDTVSNLRDYRVNIFDCTEFSDVTADILRSAGWNARRIQVKTNCEAEIWNDTNCKDFSGRHDIVKVTDVYIEATSGEIIHPDDYEAYGIR